MMFSNMAGLKKRIFSENRPKLFLTCSESFSTIPCRYFSKWRLKIFEVATTPLHSNFDGSPYPHLKGYSRSFFHQNDRKGCKRDILDARGHFLLRFCAAGDKTVRGMVTPFFLFFFFFFNVLLSTSLPVRGKHFKERVLWQICKIYFNIC